MKHVIWSNGYDEIEAIANDIMAEEPEVEEDEAWGRAYAINSDYLDDERVNLDKYIGDIIIIGTLGLWNGMRYGWRHMDEGTNLNKILSTSCGDYVTWYVEDGELMCEDIHHDGTNHYMYRTIKEGIHPWELSERVAEGEDIRDLTEPMGHYVAEIYGWGE